MDLANVETSVDGDRNEDKGDPICEFEARSTIYITLHGWRTELRPKEETDKRVINGSRACKVCCWGLVALGWCCSSAANRINYCLLASRFSLPPLSVCLHCIFSERLTEAGRMSSSMDPNPKVQEDPIREVEEEAEVTTLASFKPSPLLSTASISLSLSHLPLPPKPASSLLSPPSCKLKIPSQISSFISLSASSAPSKSSIKSTISAVPLQSPLFNLSRRSPDPSNPFGLRRATVVWFRNDLRLHDNEALSAALNDSLSVLPVYCFDPRDYGKSSSGFDKTGPYRATFLIQSVSDLRRNLQSRGSDLVVRTGKPESVLLELAKAVGAEAVYVHREVTHDEVRAEERIEEVMKEEGIETKYFWGSTLYHIDDLPFKVEDMPSNYGGFRERLQGLEVRKTIKASDQLKGLPAKGDVDVGEIPSLVDLGISPTATMPQGGKPAAKASLVGGETEALQRLQTFAAEYRAQPNKSENFGDNIYGANFSCKISPWLAMGCLSPRFMFDELKKSVNRTISAPSGQKHDGPKADNGMNWLMFELLWRDFFRFITKKYSSAKRKVDVAPATACTGAFAYEHEV